LGGGWGKIPLQDGNVNAVGRNNGHGNVGKMTLERATKIVVSTNNCGAGENGSVEVVFSGSRRARSAWGRVRKIGQAELFGNGMSDIDIW
jgi:hypothetical protein